MEFLNKIAIRGVVGRAEVNEFNDSRVCNFSVVTEYSSKDREGTPTVESTWFNVSAWGGREGIANLYDIQKGVWVEVHGRLRIRKYTNQANEDKTSMDIIARKVTLIPREEDPLQPQRDW